MKVSGKTRDMGEEGAYVRSTYLGELDDIPQSDSDVVTPEQKKSKKEKTKNRTNRKTNRKSPPETCEKSFRGELIYNKKASWILIKLKST